MEGRFFTGTGVDRTASCILSGAADCSRNHFFWGLGVLHALGGALICLTLVLQHGENGGQ